MQVTGLKLENFRNYETLDIATGNGTNVFFGENAQGKTNILEAIYLCTCASSYRTGRDADLMRQSASHYQVTLGFRRNDGVDETIRIRYDVLPNGQRQRQISHNGMILDKVGDLMGLFHAVIFAPEDTLLIKEGPAGRRRFLDLLLSQVSPSYFMDLLLYVKQLNQRNTLLKKFREHLQQGSFNKASARLQMDVWDQSLAECAGRLIAQRLRMTEEIRIRAGIALNRLTRDTEKLGLAYRTLSGLPDQPDSQMIANRFLERLAQTLEDDIQRGYTSQGPHRDDLIFTLNDEEIKPYASQGQNRSVVLALKLAELAVLKAETGEEAVLLLDDVMSELDRHRRHDLLASIEDHQVFVTCTDLNQVLPQGRETPILAAGRALDCFQVVAGQVEAVEFEAMLH